MQHDGIAADLASALADGELCGEEFAAALDWLATDERGRMSWHAYQLIGDVLRAGESMPGAHEIVFSKRLGRVLMQEPGWGTHRDATNMVAGDAVSAGAMGSFDHELEVANEARFEWRWLVSAASLAVFAIMGWQAWNGWSDPAPTSEIATVAIPDVEPTPDVRHLASAGGAEPAIMIRDPQLDALLAAHRQSGVASAFHASSGFLRNATFDGVGR